MLVRNVKQIMLTILIHDIRKTHFTLFAVAHRQLVPIHITANSFFLLKRQSNPITPSQRIFRLFLSTQQAVLQSNVRIRTDSQSP